MRSKPKQLSGFTLVEISIVMIIIGLLIGGTFGGMKLIENMQVNKTVQDLKSIESAALTFKDTYGRLPGDMPNTAARLPSCTDAPCATGGNGDRRLDATLATSAAIANTNERFTFWHHLQATGLLAMDYSNTADMTFGAGQPSSSLDGGFRVSDVTANGHGCIASGAWGMGEVFIINDAFSSAAITGPGTINCSQLRSLDNKLDDGLPYHGNLMSGWGCSLTTAVCASLPQYTGGGVGLAVYNARF